MKYAKPSQVIPMNMVIVVFAEMVNLQHSVQHSPKYRSYTLSSNCENLMT
jgi:hypothetical protein